MKVIRFFFWFVVCSDEFSCRYLECVGFAGFAGYLRKEVEWVVGYIGLKFKNENCIVENRFGDD